MDLVVLADSCAVGRAAARRVAQTTSVAGARLLLPTGRTPLPMYDQLRTQSARGSLGAAQAFQLDEYCGVGSSDPASYRAFMSVQLRGTTLTCVGPDGMAPDPRREAARYERLVMADGGIDLAVVGVGANGHVAFNEPPADRDGRTAHVELAQRTRDDNAFAFASPERVPTHAITVGIGTLLDAREIVLMACGPTKRAPLSALVNGSAPDPRCPVTLLREHPRLTVLCDHDAVSGSATLIA